LILTPKKHELTTIDWFEGEVVNVVSLLEAIIVGIPFLSKISFLSFEPTSSLQDGNELGHSLIDL
jgi:hypothetical protein